MFRLLLVVAISLMTSISLKADTPEGSSEKKVKVYILAGQSNMEEKAGFQPLAWQVGQEKYRDRYTHLIKDGDHAAFSKRYEASIAKDPKNPIYSFSERKDVWMCNHGKHGNLSADYLKNNSKFGLEVNFGHAMGNQYDEQVLIIKTAWGGRAIHRGYRPPSAIPSDDQLRSEWDTIVADQKAKKEKALAEYPKKLEEYNKKLSEFETTKAAGSLKKNQKAPKKPKDPAKQRSRGPKTYEEYKNSYGSDYRNMMTEVKAALANLKTNHPAYRDQGYEIKGFVWFQGYNDMFAEEARNNYGTNLVKLIKDVKKELIAPQMQTVIGQMGHNGDLKGLYQEKKDKATGKMVMSGNGAIRKAQLEASQHSDIKDSTALVRTAPFWDMECDAIYRGPGSWKKDVAKWQQFGADRPYHYYGSPWFFSQVGTAFGKAMIGLQSK
jgi:ribosomal protein L29